MRANIAGRMRVDNGDCDELRNRAMNGGYGCAVAQLLGAA
jgi:hypothetical protein